MISVNTFGVRTAFMKDMESTVTALYNMGFDGIEPLVIPLQKQEEIPKVVMAEDTLKKFMEIIEKLKWNVTSVHMMARFDYDGVSIDDMTEYMKKLYDAYGIQKFIFSGMFRNKEDAKKWAVHLSQLAELTKETCQVIYHNHDSELMDLNGKTLLEYFFEEAGRDVLLQIDVGWAGFAADEIEVANKFADRIESLHLKDFINGTKGNCKTETLTEKDFAAIGAGEIALKQVMNMKDCFPKYSGLMVIDQDQSAGDIMIDLKIGLENIRKWSYHDEE